MRWGSVFTFVAALLTGVWSLAGAQDPPPPSPVTVKVSTDREIYRAGEPVRIRIQVENQSNSQYVLEFPSSLQADYIIDGVYRWSDGRGFLTVFTHVRLAPHEVFAFPEFVHNPVDFYLTPNQRHEIRGEVGRYGRASTVIFVEGDTPAPPKLIVAPSIVPNPSLFGTPVEFGVTVSNTSPEPQTFGHSGCPVFFVVDGIWRPPVACPEYWRQVTLQPGESIRFGASNFEYLRVQHRVNGLNLFPGGHSVEFEVPGVGAAAARFQVLNAGGGAISGQVVDQRGVVIEGAVIQAFSPGSQDSVPPTDPSRNVPGPFEAVSGPDGAYRLEPIPAGDYILRAFARNSDEVWYNQVHSMEEATIVPVAEGDHVAGIDFQLTMGPEPPPFPGFIGGFVNDKVSGEPPIANAVVAAFLIDGVRDSVPPDDSTGVGNGGTGSTDPIPPGIPPIPYGRVFYGFTDSTGQYGIPVPYGTFHLIAVAEYSGVAGYRYQWWDHSDTFAGAVPYTVSPDARQAPANFHLEALPDRPLSITARIEGVVRAVDPADHRFPKGVQTRSHPSRVVPIPGARVQARPLVMDPRILTFREVVYEAVTGDSGEYSIEVPPTSPFVVSTQADGFDIQFYDHVSWHEGATPVDVAPRETTGGINFDLWLALPPFEQGEITGIIYSDNGTDGPSHPLPGAIVHLWGAGENFYYEQVTRTDYNGVYWFSGLPMDPEGKLTYYVSAEADGHIPAYFPGVYQWTTAQPVAPASPGARVVYNVPLSIQFARGPHFAVGLVRVEGNGGVIDTIPPDPPFPGDDPDNDGTPGAPDLSPYAGARELVEKALSGDLNEGFFPLPGAYLYLVRADELADPPPPVAGGVATENGTLILAHLPPGLYKAYADRRGFETAWFHGTGPDDAATFAVGPDIDPVLIDIVMTPVDPAVPPGGEGRDLASGAMLINTRNQPNPFKPQTTILYRLMEPARVSVGIYDLQGRLVRSLFDNVLQPAGEQRVPWDGRDEAGADAGAGVFFFRVWTPLESSTGKMVRVR